MMAGASIGDVQPAVADSSQHPCLRQHRPATAPPLCHHATMPPTPSSGAERARGAGGSEGRAGAARQGRAAGGVRPRECGWQLPIQYLQRSKGHRWRCMSGTAGCRCWHRPAAQRWPALTPAPLPPASRRPASPPCKSWRRSLPPMCRRWWGPTVRPPLLSAACRCRPIDKCCRWPCRHRCHTLWPLPAPARRWQRCLHNLPHYTHTTPPQAAHSTTSCSSRRLTRCWSNSCPPVSAASC